MATGAKGRDNRDERERARIYQARVALHEARVRRRTRDNVVAGVVGGILILAVVGLQTAYFVAGPGAPTPAPSVAPSSTVSPEPSATTSQTPEVTPQPSTTP